MADDKDDDDLYDEEFDFVDDDEFDEEDSDEDEEEEEEEEEEEAPKRKKAAPRKTAKAAKKAPKASPAPRKKAPAKRVEEELPFEEPEMEEVEAPAEMPLATSDEALDEFGRPQPVANYVVHVYEHRKLKRTIDRDFTPEDAEAFATDYNKYARSYGRIAVAGKKDVPPKKSVEMPSPVPVS